MKILILGGYGVFGGRLAELLSDLPALELLICGRNLASAQAFCTRYQGRARVQAMQLDRREIESALQEMEPDLVVDASGPFQDYGADRYKVIAACIAAQVDYLDFADAADFVFGVSQFDEQARQAGVFVLSGASSFPVLTAAVLREMAREMDIVSAEGGIAPSPYAGIGLNVMRAVIGYAGAPVKLLRGGVKTHGIGLAESMRFTVAVPGRLPLRSIHFSLVDVPDLQVIPPEHPTMTDIWIGAGPVPESLHRILNLLAKARATFHLPSWAPFSRLFYVVLNAMKFGEHRGGMFIRARGIRDGRAVERSWHLLAEGDDGPYIPSMAIEAIIRKQLAGVPAAPGARPATHALELADYDRLFAGRTIFTGLRGEEHGPLYRRILGTAFDALPPRVRELHADPDGRCWSGRAQVRRGTGWLARIVGALIGFPPAGDDVPVTVTLAPERDGERWTRNFNGRIFNSVQACGRGKDQHLLVERFGLVSVSLALVVERSRLLLIPRRWCALGLPMPNALLPRGQTFETEENGQFRFDVEIRAPILGLIVAYKGLLAKQSATNAPADPGA
jgi:hypothetical protein